MKTKPTMGRKLIAWILTLAMVITFIPMTGNAAYAAEIDYQNTTTDRTVGDFPNNYGVTISSDKAEYEEGENVYVKIEGSAALNGTEACVAIYDTYSGIDYSSTTQCYAYTGEGYTVADVEDFVLAGPDADGRVVVNNQLAAGTYYIIVMAGGSDPSMAGRWAVLPITITAPAGGEVIPPTEDPEAPVAETFIDVYASADAATATDEFMEGETVYVRANCADSAKLGSTWFGLYKGEWDLTTIANAGDSIFYDYAKDGYNGTTAKDMLASTTGVAQNWDKNLTAGTYTLVLFTTDSAKPYETAACKTFTVKETPKTFIEVYKDADAATATDEFMEGETVYVRANCADSAKLGSTWFGLYRGEWDLTTIANAGDSIFYDYAKDGYNGTTAKDMLASTTGVAQNWDKNLTAGTYTLVLFTTDSAKPYETAACKTFTVVAEGTVEPDEPVVDPYPDYYITLEPEDTLPEAVDFGNGNMVDATYTQKFINGLNIKVTAPADAHSEMWVGLYPHDWDVNTHQSLAYKYVKANSGTTLEESATFDLTDGWVVQDQNGIDIGGYRKLVLFVDGGYTVADTVYFFARPDASDAVVNLSAAEFTYNGQVQAPTVTSVEGYNSIWYDVEIPENTVNAGTYTVKAKFHGNVGGTATATYTIAPKAFTADMVAEIADQVYTGEALTPEVVVTDGETALVEGTDYDVEYANNTEEGTATVTVTAKGNYTGTATTEFEIACKHEMTTVPAVDADCVTEGNIKHFVCDICEKYFEDEEGTIPTTKEDVVIDALGHDLTVVPGTDATCDTAGNYEHYYCEVCEELFQDADAEYPVVPEDVVIPATGEHDLTAVEEVAATCETEGTAAHSVCGTCEGLFVNEDGEWVEKTAADLVIEALKHNYVGTVTTEPTCTEAGVKTFVCQNDAKHTYTEPVAAKGHDMTPVAAVAATCETAGVKAHFVCGTCKVLFEDEAGKVATTAEKVAVAKLGHKWDAGKVTKEATCTEEGVKTFVCQNDAKHTRTEAVAAAGHKYTAVVTAPTCTEGGFTTFTCACGHTYKDAVTDALGHTAVVDAAVAPTYTATGLTEGSHCSVCETVLTAQEKVAGLVPAAAKNVKVNLRTLNGGYDDIKVTWNKVTGATGYKVFYKKAVAKKWNVANVKTNSFTKANLAAGTKYQVKVVAVGKFGESKASGIYSTTTLKKLNAPTVTKSGAKVKVKWNNINGETGYQISRAAKIGGTNVIATVKGANAVSKIVKANKGKKYFYKVRAYKVVNGTKVFGPWSNVKAFTR